MTPPLLIKTLDYYDHICLMYRGNTILGYVHSSNEADWICDKLDTQVQWDFCSKKYLARLHEMKHLTITDFGKLIIN